MKQEHSASGFSAVNTNAASLGHLAAGVILCARSCGIHMDLLTCMLPAANGVSCWNDIVYHMWNASSGDVTLARMLHINADPCLCWNCSTMDQASHPVAASAGPGAEASLACSLTGSWSSRTSMNFRFQVKMAWNEQQLDRQSQAKM